MFGVPRRGDVLVFACDSSDLELAATRAGTLSNGLSLFLRLQRSFEGSPYSNTQPRVTFLRQSTALEARFIYIAR